MVQELLKNIIQKDNIMYMEVEKQHLQQIPLIDKVIIY